MNKCLEKCNINFDSILLYKQSITIKRINLIPIKLLSNKKQTTGDLQAMSTKLSRIIIMYFTKPFQSIKKKKHISQFLLRPMQSSYPNTTKTVQEIKSTYSRIKGIAQTRSNPNVYQLVNAVNRIKLQKYATMWMNLKNIMLNRKS